MKGFSRAKHSGLYKRVVFASGRLLLSLFCAFSATTLWADSAPLQIGETAPHHLSLGTILQGQESPKGVGTAIVLEFWATSCGPCRETIPHLDQLANQLANRPIQFVNISNEPPDTVSAFIKAHHLPGIVATDPKGTMGKQFGIHGIPTTVLIGPDDRIAAVTQALVVTAQYLELLMSGAPLDLPDIRILPPDPGRRLYSNNLVTVQIAPSSGASQSESGPFSRVGNAIRLRQLISWAYGISPQRIVIPPSLEHLAYSVDTWVPPERQEALGPLLQASLLAAAPIHIERGEKHMQVAVLRGPSSDRLAMAETTFSTIKCTSDEITHSGSLADLQNCLENALRLPVILENAPAGIFEFDLHWRPEDTDDLKEQIRRKLGATITIEERAVPVLLVTRLPLPGNG